MSAPSLPAPIGLPTWMIANATIAVLVFLSGFVMVEPSPSDLLLCLVVAVWAFIGLRFSRSMAPMIVLMALYCVGGFLSFTQLQEFQKPITYMATTVFLAISSIFYCAVIQNDTARRLAIIAQLGRRDRLDLDLLTDVIEQNADDPEFFIRKAIGWALRDAARTRPDEARAFVAAHRLSPLSAREALKNL